MEGTVNHRIKQIIKHLELNPNSFSVRLGMRDTTIRNILKDRNKPSYDVIIKIISTFEEISPIWLLQGTGEMLLVDEQKRVGILPGDTKKLPSSVLDLEINEETVSVLHTNEPPEEYHGAKKSLLMVEVYIKNDQIIAVKPVNDKYIENLKVEIDKNKEALQSLTRIVTRNLKD